MKRPWCGLSRVFLCLWIAGFVLPSFAGAQTARPPFGQGTHAFRRILFDLQLQPLSSMEQLGEDPEHTLWIVLGQTDDIVDIPDRFLLFLRRGGALLVATDRPMVWRSGGFALEIPGDKVTSLDSQAYQGIRECPLVQAIGTAEPALFGSTELRMPPVATNLSSYVLQRSLALPRGMRVLAQFPDNCRYGDRLKPAPQPFAVGGPYAAGRLLVLADHSVFINDMMLQADTGNIDFTYNAVDWLTDKGKRNRVLLHEEGRINDDFNIPLKDLPPQLPPLNTVVPIIDNAIVGMERDNVFDRVLLDLIPGGTKEEKVGRLLLVLTLFLTLLLVVYGFYRLTKARHQLDLWSPLFDKLAASQVPVPNVLEQRHHALLRKGNFWEPGRELARRAFAALSVPEDAAEPEIQVQGSWRQRWALPPRVRRLWRLAHGDVPVQVSAGQFAQLQHEVRAIEAALAAGTLRLSFPTESTAPRPAPRPALSAIAKG